jgi:AcrR family transcriptional regulator
MEKQNRKHIIAHAALQLFSEHGVKGTSTVMIAQKAKVSEALIFKYYGNKEKLLSHIINSGYTRAVELTRGMFLEKNPQKLIHKTLDLPSVFVKNDPLFWKLQKRLLANEPIAQKQHDKFILPVKALLKKAFKSLGYPFPVKETKLILLIIDALWKKQVKQPNKINSEFIAFIKAKYSI